MARTRMIEGRTQGWMGAALAAAVVAMAGCSASSPKSATPARKPSAAAKGSCMATAPGKRLVALSQTGESATVALGRWGNRTLAYVADEDDAVVHVVDVDKGTELGTHALKGHPGQVLIDHQGRVLVALRDSHQVQVLEGADSPEKGLNNLCSIPVANEPIAMASAPDHSKVLVTSGWGHTLTGLKGDTLKPSFRVPLAREPRAVTISSDGKKAFINHAVGSRVSAVDLTIAEHPVRTVNLAGRDDSISGFRGNGRSSLAAVFKGSGNSGGRMGCQGFALAKTMDPPGRILAPQVLVNPGDTSFTPSGYGDGGQAAEVASIAVIDSGNARTVSASLHLPSGDPLARPNASRSQCLLPRAAAASAKNGTLLVACMGIDAIVEYDAGSADPRSAEVRRWTVGAGPTGIAVDEDKHRALVWSQFDQSLSIIPLSSKSSTHVKVVALSRKAKSAAAGDIALGRKLFHKTGDNRISSDGRACASCHPDGRDDSITWATPNGPRNTPMLAGRLAKSAPFGWNGSSEKVEEHLHQTFQRLGGTGLRGRELAALTAYLKSMRAPTTWVPKHGKRAESIARGKVIFVSKEANCASCHKVERDTTDGAAHDVKSKANADRAPGFDTPSLRFVAGTAPYFHDGRYRTLRAVLRGSDGKMGHTKHLNDQQLRDLEAYMRSL